MKTLWLFLVLQIVSWSAGLTVANRFLDLPYPKAAYITAGGCFVGGFSLFLWFSAKIETLTPFLRLVFIVIALGGIFYIPNIANQLEAKWIGH